MSVQFTIFDFMQSPGSVSDDIKQLIRERGYGEYLQSQTRISLESVDLVQGKGQIAVVLLNDDTMTFITFLLDGTSFKSWEISPATNKNFNDFKKNLFSKPGPLSTIGYRTVDIVVSEYYDRFAKSSEKS